MRRDIEIEDVAHLIPYLLDARIAEFQNVSAILADEVIVLFVFKRLIKERNIFSKMMFHNQVAVQQQFYGVVDSGAAYPVFLALHL